ncbi:MAG: tRNA (adenosine(37)-N6)-dimethylallyltransferase MiaA [Flavobacteriales bacterium]|nr:tRNA (adenosine(37)-N6)-dimethylallyltransferase MiaA [Flavobacteriales bacterium]
MTGNSKHLIVIGGPTASGKTATAVHWAKALGGELISADSRQVYREMKIGTDRPDVDSLQGIPCYLSGSVSIHDPFDTADFEQQALEAIGAIHRKNAVAILVGGTGLYINAVCEGLDEMPDVPANIRTDLNNTLETEGIEKLKEELKRSDPVFYTQADIENPRRVIRALEIYRATGKPYSSFRKKDAIARPFSITWLALDADREVLYEKINERVDMMMASGLEEEARKLYPFRDLPALHTIGYQELFSYFDGNISMEKAVNLIKQNSRRYAKRQWTWFRNDGRYQWMNKDISDDILNEWKQEHLA